MTAYEPDATPSAVIALDEPPVAFPHVQRFSDGFFLVVGSRCHWRPEGPEPNAYIISSDGNVERSGTLGDGLEHVQIDSKDNIWTGYFDEGIFGNYGWGHPGPTPLGAAGIVTWSRTFTKIWELDPTNGLVYDCYALNAGGGDVWACPYTDFPVVRISEDRVDSWQTQKVPGPQGILVGGGRVALVGTRQDPSLLIVGHLAKGNFVEDRRTHLQAANGEPPQQFGLHCSGSIAHVFVGNAWSTFDLDDLN